MFTLIFLKLCKLTKICYLKTLILTINLKNKRYLLNALTTLSPKYPTIWSKEKRRRYSQVTVPMICVHTVLSLIASTTNILKLQTGQNKHCKSITTHTWNIFTHHKSDELHPNIIRHNSGVIFQSFVITLMS